MRARTVVAALAVSAALGSILEPLLEDVELPPVRSSNCVQDLFPELDLGGIEIGDYEWQAYEIFGKKVTRPLLFDSQEPRRCVAFVYDENMLWDPPLFLTVLVDARRVRGKWLAKTAFPAPECGGLPQEVVDLKGRFHAGACWQ